LPVAGSGVALYMPERFEPSRWAGDFQLQRHWRLPPPKDDLTVRVPLTGERRDLSRLGDGGTIAVTIIDRHLRHGLMVVALVIGLTLVWWLRRRVMPLAVIIGVGAAATVLVGGLWSMVIGTLVIAVMCGGSLLLIAGWWRGRAERQKADHGLTPDPWLEKSP
jgi:hypothetical protein